MKRLLAATLVAGTLAMSILVLEAAPAGACSCAPSADADALARSDAVFVGEVAGYDGPSPGESFSSTDPAVWTFAVSEVFKGEVAPTQRIVSEVSGASCGLEIPRRGEFLVFAQARVVGSSPEPAEGELYAGLCGGTRATRDGSLDPALATGHAPTSEAAPSPGGDASAATRTPSDRDNVTLVAGIVVGAALGVGVALLVLRRRRNARGATP